MLRRDWAERGYATVSSVRPSVRDVQVPWSREVAYAFSIRIRSNDLGWPSTAETHSCGKKSFYGVQKQEAALSQGGPRNNNK